MATYVAARVASSMASLVAARVAARVASLVAVLMKLLMAARVEASVAVLIAELVVFVFVLLDQIAVAIPAAHLATNGEGAITTLGRCNPADSYNLCMALVILSLSIGVVLKAMAVHFLTSSSILTFSSGVIPPSALVGVRTILDISLKPFLRIQLENIPFEFFAHKPFQV